MSWALYPSLEDMKVDQYLKSQNFQGEDNIHINMPDQMESLGLMPTAPPLTLPRNSEFSASKDDIRNNIQLDYLNTAYPQLDSEYMGLNLCKFDASNNPDAVTTCLSSLAQPQADPNRPQENIKVLAPLSGQYYGHQRSAMTGAIREVILCKDERGKIGLRLRSVNKGIFVLIVAPHSPSSLAGIKFGDQIVQIDGTNVAGMDSDKVEKIITKARHDIVHMIVRDRPFERTITMHKDSNGYIGFVFKHGRITCIVKDSSAARNGLLIDHYLLEVNGKNVVGLKDSDIKTTIERAGNSINLTVMPSYIFEHMIKNLSLYTVRKSMDRALSGTNDL